MNTESSQITWLSAEKGPSTKQVAQTDFCSRQLNLLAHAQAIELEVGSRCGGHGVCGGDRVRVLTQANDSASWSALTEAERDHLSEQEISEGWRLACQCYPNREDRDFQIVIHSTT